MNEVVAEIPLSAALVVSRIAYGAGSVWAFATSAVAPDTVVRVDPAANSVVATIPLGHAALTMAFGFDALWVTAPTDDLILRIDPATDTVEEWASDVEGAGVLAIGEDALWVSLLGEHGSFAGLDDPTIVRIDPAHGKVTAAVATGGSVEVSGGVAASPDAIWVRAADPFLVRIDPRSAELLESIDVPRGSGDVTVAFGSVWVTSEHGDVIRLDPGP
jgi:DNA-binding beta-propeller fold protein YncE